MKIQDYAQYFNHRLIESVNSNTAILIEKGKAATLKKIIIENVPSDAILLKIDNATSIPDIVDPKKSDELGLGKRCDYILITKLGIFYMELKSSYHEIDTRRDCLIKFKATECITEYFDSFLKKLPTPLTLFSDQESFYILFVEKLPIAKTSTNLRSNRKTSNNTPEKMFLKQISNEGIVKLKSLKL